jgi:hypothetical protein
VKEHAKVVEKEHKLAERANAAIHQHDEAISKENKLKHVRIIVRWSFRFHVAKPLSFSLVCRTYKLVNSTMRNWNRRLLQRRRRWNKLHSG